MANAGNFQSDNMQNTLLRTQLENVQQPGKMATGGGGSSLLLHQLAKQPQNDPPQAILKQVAIGLASVVPNDKLSNLVPSQTSTSGGCLIMSDPDGASGYIKQEIKNEPSDIKQEPIDMDTLSAPDTKPPIMFKSENDFSHPIKKEPEASAAPKPEPPKIKLPGSTSVDSKTGKKKIIFSPDELKKALEPPLTKMYNLEDSLPFRVPVDPALQGIPDYFDIIKHPMDLSTIKRKLDQGSYANPWEYVDDIWLMFNNAWTYNRKTSKVFKQCSKVR
jgi:E1A/CREB-binding protein